MGTAAIDRKAPCRLVVVGSLNVDLVATAARIPAPGETVLARGALATHLGGKGANQAVAAARLGAPTAMVGRVGDDAYGRMLVDGLARDRVDTRGVAITAQCASGVAMIVVDDAAGNAITVVPGANALLAPDEACAALATVGPDTVVALQLEVPLATVIAAATLAHGRGATVLLNPAPAQPLPDALLAAVDLLVANEGEAAMLSGLAVAAVEDAARAGAVLLARGVGKVLVTLGAQGVVLAERNAPARHFAARTVRAVDTTGAGDTFVGGLCAGLIEGLDVGNAIALGQAAAAIQVTRPGAQSAMPRREELGGG